MRPSILGIGTAVPEFKVPQDTYAQFTIDAFGMSEEDAGNTWRICKGSAIESRYFCVDDALKSRQEWEHLPRTFPEDVPMMSDRNQIYKTHAPELARQASVKALEDWGGEKDDITHVISVSCTGITAPGLEFLLIESLGLRRTVQRLGINFMGCFGAFKGLAIANALALENARHRILVVCTELCSIQFQPNCELESIVGNCLFADGSAAVVVGFEPSGQEKILWQLLNFHSYALSDSLGEMTWNAVNHGLIIHLTAEIPRIIHKHVRKFATELLEPDISFSDCAWPVHPGGKAIVKAIEMACELEPWQTAASWDVLSRYGNMSSPTFLFVLNELGSSSETAPYAVGIGFGPGLSFEGVLLKTG